MIKQTIRMLSVDDKSLTTSLDRAGYRDMGVIVNIAANFDEYQARIQKTDRPIDIIVINLDYPANNAPQIIESARSSTNSSIPIILTSVQARVAERKKLLELGANLFIEQPVPRTYFIEKAKALLTQATRSDGRLNSEQFDTAQITLDDKEYQFPVSDLSSSGILLKTEEVFEIGTHIEISLVVPGYKKALQFVGEIVRHVKGYDNDEASDDYRGLGVRFSSYKGDSQKRLVKFLSNANLDNKEMIFYL